MTRRPASLKEAEGRMADLLGKAVPGSRATIKRHRARARFIGRWIYQRYRVASPGVRAKHFRACLDWLAARRSLHTVYAYWLTIGLLTRRLGREGDWTPRLRGPWVREGRGGRPRKRPRG